LGFARALNDPGSLSNGLEGAEMEAVLHFGPRCSPPERYPGQWQEGQLPDTEGVNEGGQPRDASFVRDGTHARALRCMAVESMLACQARAGHAPGAPGKVFPRFGVAPRVGVKDSHSSVWPLEWSVTHKKGIL